MRRPKGVSTPGVHLFLAKPVTQLANGICDRCELAQFCTEVSPKKSRVKLSDRGKLG